MARPDTRERLFHAARNDRLFDLWSLVHLATGVVLGWVMDPFVALVLMILWEPLEILVISPLAKKWVGITYGHESWRNAMSDIAFDAAGVALGAYVLLPLAAPPFSL